MLKKRWRCVFISFLIVGLYCSVAFGAEKPVLKFWYLKSYVPPANETLEKNVQEWAAKNGVKVKIDFFTFDTMSVKYTSGIETGALPDVGEMESFDAIRFASMGKLTEVADLLKTISSADGGLLPNLDLGITFHGKIYGIPHYQLVNLLYCRKDLLDKIGARVPQTWQELSDTATKIHNAGYMTYPIGEAWTYQSDGYNAWQGVLYSYGASFADKEGNFKPYFNQPKAREAIKWATNIYIGKPRLTPPDCLAWKGYSNNEAWLRGEIGFTWNGPSIWYRLVAENHPLKNKTILALTPAGPEGLRVGIPELMVLGVFKTTKYPKLAKSLIKYLLSKEPHEKFIKSAYGQVSPAYYNFTKMDFWKENPNQLNCMEIGKYTGLPGYPGPVTPAAASVVASFIDMDMLQSIITGHLSMDEAIKIADKKKEEIYRVLPH
ncbi:MAG TPA: extracellular solute-binding protein [Candidatus Aerophobetes bacterium]|uniref:Extracellular solute-binding protein n=1 Tax=Aerophobetes bacterium TaxID=2030807 RepID=A0A7V0N0D2_UNCAE|nr:extracellular solute-binding protein [Candidatus Aerophobetes bacterium]